MVYQPSCKLISYITYKDKCASHWWQVDSNIIPKSLGEVDHEKEVPVNGNPPMLIQWNGIFSFFLQITFIFLAQICLQLDRGTSFMSEELKDYLLKKEGNN